MVRILDSTLREGEQAPGVYFSPTRKLEIARLLDEMGIEFIEAGNPAVDAEIAESVTQIAHLGLRAKIGAHSRCRIDDVEKALNCGIQFLGIFRSVSDERLRCDYHMTLKEAIDQVVAVIEYARSFDDGLWIRYTAEDGTRSPIDNVLKISVAAAKAGANIISIADTTGYSTPFDSNRMISSYVTRVKHELSREGLDAWVAVHCHNDRGLALANALDSMRAGVDIIDASVLGLGERAGIVDLAELMLSLHEEDPAENRCLLDRLQDLYDLVSAHSGIPIPDNRPIVGRNAFTHSAGVHVRAFGKEPGLYQSLDPAIFKRQWKFCLGMQSGRATVELALERIGRGDLKANRELVDEILKEVKGIARDGGPVDVEVRLPSILERCINRMKVNATFK